MMKLETAGRRRARGSAPLPGRVGIAWIAGGAGAGEPLAT
jgi:hypothetical protein